jgi:streptomycin 6-kinase
VHGEPREAWLRRLPALVGELAECWGLSLGAPFELSFNYVMAVTRGDGTEAVLKVCAPDPEAPREIAALRAYAGEGACRLLEVDEGCGALLLERVRPGAMLVHTAARDDDAATGVAARLLPHLWRPVPPGHTFRPLAEWFRAFERHRAAHGGGSGPLPLDVLERGERAAEWLIGSTQTTVLLHGDFHHFNVLSSARAGWLAIDPKGVTGDPGYDVAPFLVNPSRPTPQRLSRRLAIFSEELGYDRDRLRDWGIAHAVLSACWSLEDQDEGWQEALITARMLMQA